MSSSAQEAAAPSQQQLKQLHNRCGGARELSQEQIQALGAQLGISRSIVSKVLAVGRLDGGSAVEVDRFLFLLLVMSCDSFATVLLQLFDLFGRTLEAERFHLLISYLAPDMDPDVTSQVCTSRGRLMGMLRTPIASAQDHAMVPGLMARTPAAAAACCASRGAAPRQCCHRVGTYCGGGKVVGECGSSQRAPNTNAGAMAAKASYSPPPPPPEAPRGWGGICSFAPPTLRLHCLPAVPH